MIFFKWNYPNKYFWLSPWVYRLYIIFFFAISLHTYWVWFLFLFLFHSFKVLFVCHFWFISNSSDPCSQALYTLQYYQLHTEHRLFAILLLVALWWWWYGLVYVQCTHWCTYYYIFVSEKITCQYYWIKKNHRKKKKKK